MTASRWQQVKAIFQSAVELDPDALDRFIRESCGGDEELLREVQSLLAADVEARDLIENPLVPAGAIAAAAPEIRLDPMLRRAIGNYVITSELARGGMGIVYRARHVSLPRDVVVKSIRPTPYEVTDELRARFRREAHIQSQLDHPHIVRVHEFFETGNEYFLVLEYVHGSSLRSLLNERRVLPVEEATAFALQTLEALEYAHNFPYVDEAGNPGAGVVHRDIKPANMLIDENGNLKLTDFGIVKLAGDDQFTKPGSSPGTVDYMSPEQILNRPLDARTDVYSLGVTLYEMLAGCLPFQTKDRDSAYEVLREHIEIEPPNLRISNPHVPLFLADAIARCLKRDPGRRWQTAGEFRDALCQRNHLASRIPGRQRQRRPGWLITGIWAALILAVFVAVLWRQRSQDFRLGKDEASIAVLPFADMSAEKNQEYFSDGLAEEVLNDLARIPRLRVVARTSSFQFKNHAGDFRLIGKQLHVAAILEGSVRRQGNRAKVAVHLINAADGYSLWSETFDQDVNDIFAVEDKIGRAVSGALKVTLLRGKAALPSAQGTNAGAYNAYLLGQYFLQSNNSENLEKAVGYFEQAVKLDPGYAKAWVGLAESRSAQAGADNKPGENYRKAKESAARALALDPGLGEAHAAMAWAKQFGDWDWEGADTSYKHALALGPGNAIVISHAGTLARILGHLDEAAGLARKAMQIDPLHAGTYHNAGITFYYAGLYDESEAAFRKALELVPEMAFPHGFIGRVYLAQSRSQEALAEAESEKYPAFRLFGLALANHALGRKQESNANLTELDAKFQSPSYLLAEVYAFRGETDRAFESLDRAYATHDTGLAQLKGDPLLRSLASDRRYTELLRKMRL